MRFRASITFSVLDLVIRTITIFLLLYRDFFHLSYKLLYILWMHSTDGPGWISARIDVKVHFKNRRAHNADKYSQEGHTFLISGSVMPSPISRA